MPAISFINKQSQVQSVQPQTPIPTVELPETEPIIVDNETVNATETKNWIATNRITISDMFVCAAQFYATFNFTGTNTNLNFSLLWSPNPNDTNAANFRPLKAFRMLDDETENIGSGYASNKVILRTLQFPKRQGTFAVAARNNESGGGANATSVHIEVDLKKVSY